VGEGATLSHPYVPSCGRVDNNILINEAHPEFKKIATSLNQPVIWDSHFFKARFERTPVKAAPIPGNSLQ